MHKLHLIPDLLCSVASSVACLYIARTLAGLESFRSSASRRFLLHASCAALIILFFGSWAFTSMRVASLFPPMLTHLVQASGMAVGFCVVGCAAIVALLRMFPPFREERRHLFRAAGAVMLAAPPVVTAFGIVRRNDFQLNEIRLPVPHLPRDLQGLRIVQITDVHLSAFLSENDLARAVDMANGARAHLAVMTGDLITRPGDPLDACIRQLARLRADAGVYGCLGNHEVYCRTEDYVTRECARRGIRFLRAQAATLQFGNSAINLAGVDYQPMNWPNMYLWEIPKLVRKDQVNVLLSHNPDVFRTAAKQGWQAVLAGHTHGGQVNVEILHQNVNVARFFTPYVRGAYHLPASSIYVCSGIGTIGMPIRLGAPPEVSVIELCAS
jgi:predicted MPP superfamily phosphohydrolase